MFCKRYKNFISFILVLFMFFWGGSGNALLSFAGNNDSKEQNKSSKRFIVKYKDDKNGRKLLTDNLGNKILKKKILNNNKERKKNDFDALSVEVSSKNDFISLMYSQNLLELVDYVVEDNEVKLSSVDTYFDSQWGLSGDLQSVAGSTYGVNALPTWDMNCGDNIKVAVIDSGIDITHEDLAENIAINEVEVAYDSEDNDLNSYIDDTKGWNFCDDSNDVHTIGDEEHGTHVAGVISAVYGNGKGISGTAPKARILPIKAFKNGSAYVSDIIESIEYAQEMGASVVNCSWGSSENNRALYETIKASNMLFCCAAGNDGVNIDNNPVYPASYKLPNVIAVGASNANGEKASFSNFGSGVDVTAPGDNILSTLPDNVYGNKSGTSIACAFVSAEAAMIFCKNNNYTPLEVKNTILLSSDSSSTLEGVFKHGIVDTYKAISNNYSFEELSYFPQELNIDQSSNGSGVDSVYDSVYNSVYGSVYNKDFNLAALTYDFTHTDSLQSDFQLGTFTNTNSLTTGGVQQTTKSIPSFTRNSNAYKLNGTAVTANAARYETGKYSSGLLLESGRECDVSNPFFANGSTAGWSTYINTTSGATATVSSTSGGSYGAGNNVARINVTNDGTTYHDIQFYQSVGAVTTGQSISAQIRIKASVATTAKLVILNNASPYTQYSSITLNLTTSWQEFSTIATIPESVNARVDLFLGHGSGDNVTYDIDYIVADNTGTNRFITTPFDGARQNESLKIPLGNVFNPAKGTLEMIVIPKNLRSKYARIAQVGAWTADNSKDDFRVTWDSNSPNKMFFSIVQSGNASTPTTNITLPANFVEGNKYYVAARWELPGTIKLTVYDYANSLAYNSSLATTLTPNFSLFSNLNIGNNGGSWDFDNAIHDDIRISSISRTDSEISSTYLSGASSPTDSYTTYKMNFDGALNARSGGLYESDVIDVSSVGISSASQIGWTSVVTTYSSIAVETNLSTDGGTTWQGWKSATNGSTISSIPSGTDLSNGRLKYRAFFTTSSVDINPRLSSITLNIAKAVQMSNIAVYSGPKSIDVVWDKIVNAQSYDVEFDGVVTLNILDCNKLFTGLTPNTVHNVRIRGVNQFGAGVWSGILTTSTKNTMSKTLNVTNVANDNFNLSLKAVNIPDTDVYEFLITYNSAQIKVIDLCAGTSKIDTTIGIIPNSDIEIRGFTSGSIRLAAKKTKTLGKSWFLGLNRIKFQAITSGTTVINYTVQ